MLNNLAGGYIKPKEFTAINQSNSTDLKETENIHASLVGLSVDYLTRILIGTSKDDTFKISLLGAELAKEKRDAIKLLINISGLDDISIINAYKLSGYDVCSRSYEFIVNC